MDEMKSKYEELKRQSENIRDTSTSLVIELHDVSTSMEELGNLYLSAESMKRAAIMQRELAGVNEEQIRTAAIYLEEASKKYYSINYYQEAAKYIKEAASIYLDIKDFKQAYKCYGLAKNYYGDAGDYDNCGVAYFNEMDNKRQYYLALFKNTKKNRFQSFLKYIKYEAFKVTTNYGESIFRLIINSFAIISIFSFLFFLLQNVQLPDDSKKNIFFVNPSYSIDYYIACLKFSLSLFSGYSTTPYILYKYNFISTVEVILGNGFLALFIAIILRKISRR